MDALLKQLLMLRHLEYLTLGRDLLIAAASPGVQRFADSSYELAKGIDFRLGLPELIGVEAELAAIAAGQQENFALDAIARCTQAGASLYFDLCITKLESAEFPDSNLMVVFEDVTERVVLEQSLVQASNEMSLLLTALTTSRNYLDKIITSIANALFVTTATGAIKACNRAAQALLKYNEEDLIHQPFATIVADENFLFQAIQSTASQSETKDIEIVCHTKTGEKRSIAFSCSVIHEADLQEFILLGRDVTGQQT